MRAISLYTLLLPLMVLPNVQTAHISLECMHCLSNPNYLNFSGLKRSIILFGCEIDPPHELLLPAKLLTKWQPDLNQISRTYYLGCQSLDQTSQRWKT